MATGIIKFFSDHAALGVFLHSYPEGTSQSRVNVAGLGTRRFFCPEPDWFKLRMSLSVQNAVGETGCAAAGTGTWTGADELPTEFWLKYFAIVKVKTVWQDVLTYLSEEEFWGLEFFHYPTDFFLSKWLSSTLENTTESCRGCLQKFVQRARWSCASYSPRIFCDFKRAHKPNELFCSGKISVRLRSGK